MVEPSKRRQALFLQFQAGAVVAVSLDIQASPASQGFLATTLARAASLVSVVTQVFLVTAVCRATQALAFLVSQAFQDFLA